MATKATDAQDAGGGGVADATRRAAAPSALTAHKLLRRVSLRTRRLWPKAKSRKPEAPKRAPTRNFARDRAGEGAVAGAAVDPVSSSLALKGALKPRVRRVAKP
jgi:hypothetical protein